MPGACSRIEFTMVIEFASQPQSTFKSVTGSCVGSLSDVLFASDIEFWRGMDRPESVYCLVLNVEMQF